MTKDVVWGLAGKLFSDMSKHVRFWVHRQIAKEVYAKLRILNEEQFDEMARGRMWGAFKDAPRMFQTWASKQVMNVAGVNKNLTKYKPRQSKKWPSYGKAINMCAHVLACREERRVKNLRNSLSLRLVAIGECMAVRSGDTWHLEVLSHTVCSRERSNEDGEHSLGKNRQFWELGRSMDKIGWRRFI